MSRFFRSISVFLLLLAGLVIVVHQIIPHDHHTYELAAGHDDSCPYSDSRSDHHPVFPVHCHAFNDLASEKAIAFVPGNNIQNSCLFFSDLTHDCAVNIQIPLGTIIDFSVPLTDSDLSGLALLRAPPSLI
jgi:hypothetical protein